MEAQQHYTFTDVSQIGSWRKRWDLSAIAKATFPKEGAGRTFLEGGAGRGEMAHIVKSLGYQYIGIEPGDQLRERLIQADFKVLSNTLPSMSGVDAASIDVFYSYDVVEHLDSYAAVIKMLEETGRVLRPEGIVVAIAPNSATLGYLFDFYEYQHQFLTTLPRLVAMFEDVGFQIDLARPFLTPLGLSRSGVVRAVDRVVANAALVILRQRLVNSVLSFLIGSNLLFRIHKNVYDHVVVVARKSG
ncbi:MAG: methyltransferase domain-containing protein [Gammaproteobacteria bacterium]